MRWESFERAGPDPQLDIVAFGNFLELTFFEARSERAVVHIASHEEVQSRIWTHPPQGRALLPAGDHLE